jgi:hypothetical protein
MNTLERLRAGELAGSRQLKLACHLTEFPREIFDLADTLEILDLSGNALSRLPDDLPRLGKLRILFCSDNQFTELPGILGQCPQLSMAGFKANRIRQVSAKSLPARLGWLILTDNQIEELPAGIGNCAQLQKLMLAGNRLRALPPELAACTRLELLRISANRLTELPGWLLALPRLSWLACGGNPFSAALEAAALKETPMAGIPWGQLQIQQQLGEGASGVIHRAQHRLGAESMPVAVKLFKGAVTSDGWPDCEMAACMHAGDHANLIPVLGRVHDHPAGANGLIMALIAPEFRNLAGPPSLDSCTRDIYAEETRLTPGSLLDMACGIASAASHLHQRGIMHGDLYGHNILHNGRGQALLGDLGAASFFAADSLPLAHGLQRLEVRAFACLLEEWMERCDAPPASRATMAALSALKNDCLREDAGGRPLFDEIERALAALVQSHRSDSAELRIFKQ